MTQFFFVNYGEATFRAAGKKIKKTRYSQLENRL